MTNMDLVDGKPLQFFKAWFDREYGCPLFIVGTGVQIVPNPEGMVEQSGTNFHF